MKYIISLMISVFYCWQSSLKLTQLLQKSPERSLLTWGGFDPGPTQKTKQNSPEVMLSHTVFCLSSSKRCLRLHILWLFPYTRGLGHLSTLAPSCSLFCPTHVFFLWKQNVLEKGGKGWLIPTPSSDSKLGSGCNSGAPRYLSSGLS